MLQLLSFIYCINSYKPVVVGPSWASSASRPRFNPEPQSAGHDLVYEDIEPGKFIAGRGPLGTNTAGALEMSKQLDKHSTKLAADEIIHQEIGEKELLQLSPKTSLTTKRDPSSGPAWDTIAYDRIARPIPTAGQHVAHGDPNLIDPGENTAAAVCVQQCFLVN